MDEGLKLDTFEEVVDFAIRNEIAAADLYTGLAEASNVAGIKRMFQQFANEEKGHRMKLEGIKEGKTSLPLKATVADLKLAEYFVEVAPKPDMNYQDTLIFAMKKEKEAYVLYTKLAEHVEDPAIKELFFALAQEEAKHKLRFEMEYDDEIMKGN